MGMQQAVLFEGEPPTWSAVRDVLRQAGSPVPGMRMIDGEVALPDEAPSADWRELRVAWPDGSGMVTVGREQPGRIELVVWGNADQTLQQAWRLLAWAFATAAAGQVEADGQRYSPAAFAQAVGLAV